MQSMTRTSQQVRQGVLEKMIYRVKAAINKMFVAVFLCKKVIKIEKFRTGKRLCG
ncbi:MAG: hypothetical protein MRZ65_01080 [Lachnospiraceae bacterium]|nr:hypothetical protein [Lachnospiraceae bacterium]